MTTSMAKVNDSSDDQVSATSATRRRAPIKSVVVALIVMLLGLGVLLYPVVATQVTNYRQHQVAEQYADAVTVLDTSQRERLLAQADEYNGTVHGSPTHDPWRQSEAYDAPAFKGYLTELNADRIGREDAPVSVGLSSPMAQILIPKIKVNLPIYHGTGKEALDRGVGHLYGTSLPVGGSSSHSVLTGHTGITRATLFDNLTELSEGDAFYVNSWGRKLKYEVDQIRVVLPSDTKDLELVDGRDFVTLITCTPYGINDHRLLVRGHRVPMDPAVAEDVFTAQGLQWQWWMYAIFAASLIALTVVLWLLWRLRRRRSDAGQAKET